MPQIRANPNRMELLKLKRRGAVARRGHKLLKDKLDELMKEFQGRIGANRRLRAEVERELAGAYSRLAMARAEAGQAALGAALLSAGPQPVLTVSERSLMSVRVPVFELAELPEPGSTRACRASPRWRPGCSNLPNARRRSSCSPPRSRRRAAG